MLKYLAQSFSRIVSVLFLHHVSIVIYIGKQVEIDLIVAVLIRQRAMNFVTRTMYLVMGRLYQGILEQREFTKL